MATIKSERLREARKKAGFESAADAAQRFNWTESAYRHHENGTRGFGADAAKKYGRAFKVKPGWLLAIDGIDDGAPITTPTSDDLVVNAAVEAGTWKPSREWDGKKGFVIEGLVSPVPNTKRFGLVVEGDSMDELYEEGTVLDCISIFKGGAKPKTGDRVVVEAVRPDGLRETTVKIFVEEDGRFFAEPRSSNPRHQRLEIGSPDEDHVGDDEVRVIAFAVAAYDPQTIDLFRRLGLVRPLRNSDT